MKSKFSITSLLVCIAAIVSAQNSSPLRTASSEPVVNEGKLEIVTTLDVRPGNVAVSSSGRIFATLHPLGGSKVKLIEIKDRQTQVPYPDASYQSDALSGEKSFDTPLGINFDADGRMWVIDMGLQLGRTRLWCIDISTDKVIKIISLPQDVAPKGSFIQDLAIDSKNGWAYLADIADPGVIAVNLKSEATRRLTFSQFQSEDIDMIIDGKLVYFGGKPARVGVNPITLSNDGNTLYFGAMNGINWYSLDASLVRSTKSDAIIGQSIKHVGPKPISDGVATDKSGNHFFTNITEHAISRLDHKGKLTTILKDSQIQWPDNVSLSSDGYLYLSVNQLNTTPAFTGDKDSGNAPYHIFRFKL